MPITLQRFPPQDNAAGIMVVRYQQADFRSIFQRVHLLSAIPADIVAAFNAYAAIVKLLYDNSWNIDLTAAFSVALGVATRIPAPVASTVPGTSTDATDGFSGVIQGILMFQTENPGHRARLRYEATGGAAIAQDSQVAANSGGTTLEKIVALVTNPANNYCAHDGTRLQAPAGLSWDFVARDRAKGRRKL